MEEKAMKRLRWMAAAVLLGGAMTAAAAELVGVSGSNRKFTTSMDVTIGNKPYQLRLTGTAVRQKYLFNVYSIGSYVVDSASVRTAEELSAVDQPKQLHLVMERDVNGSDIAEAFLVAIRQNYPSPAFDDEVGHLVEQMRAINLKKDDNIYLTHQPGIGLRCQVISKGDFTIDNPAFSRAIWDIYFGKNNLGEGIKKGLTSRLR
jgi:hypothetical protein